MDKKYSVKFCPYQRYPVTMVYDGEEVILRSNNYIFMADSEMNLIKRLKGTKPHIVGNINVIKCIQ